MGHEFTALTDGPLAGRESLDFRSLGSPTRRKRRYGIGNRVAVGTAVVVFGTAA